MFDFFCEASDFPKSVTATTGLALLDKGQSIYWITSEEEPHRSSVLCTEL